MAARGHEVGRADRGAPARRDEAGLTLIEMMVAVLIIGVILAALASVLVTVLRATVHNEAETAATALVQQEVERLQAAPWDQAGLLQGEVDEAPDDWSDRLDSGDPGRFDGDELAIISPPEGAQQRPSQAPFPVSTTVEQPAEDEDENGEDGEDHVDVDGRDFRILRYVTWVDRTGDGTPETRRFTVVATWDVQGRDREVVASGERTPTQGEAPATEYGVRLLNFLRSPDPVWLDEDAHLVGTVDVEVRLNSGVTNGRLHFYEAVLTQVEDEDGLPIDGEWEIEYEARSLGMSPVAGTADDDGYTRWSVSLTPGQHTFVAGTMPLRFTASLPAGGGEFSARASLRLRGGDIETEEPYPTPGEDGSTEDGGSGSPPDEEDPPPADVTIQSVTVVGTPCRDPDTWRLTHDVLLRVQTQGLSDEDPVDATYNYRSRTNTGNGHLTTGTQLLDYVSGGSSQTFEMTLSSGSDRYFASGDTLEFTVEASREDGGNDADSASKTVETAPCS